MLGFEDEGRSSFLAFSTRRPSRAGWACRRHQRPGWHRQRAAQGSLPRRGQALGPLGLPNPSGLLPFGERSLLVGLASLRDVKGAEPAKKGKPTSAKVQRHLSLSDTSISFFNFSGCVYRRIYRRS